MHVCVRPPPPYCVLYSNLWPCAVVVCGRFSSLWGRFLGPVVLSDSGQLRHHSTGTSAGSLWLDAMCKNTRHAAPEGWTSPWTSPCGTTQRPRPPCPANNEVLKKIRSGQSVRCTRHSAPDSFGPTKSPPTPCASTLRVRKTTVRRVPCLDRPVLAPKGDMVRTELFVGPGIRWTRGG